MSKEKFSNAGNRPAVTFGERGHGGAAFPAVTVWQRCPVEAAEAP